MKFKSHKICFSSKRKLIKFLSINCNFEYSFIKYCLCVFLYFTFQIFKYLFLNKILSNMKFHLTWPIREPRTSTANCLFRVLTT